MSPAMNINRSRNGNDEPYVAVDPFKLSIMRNHRTHAVRLDNTAYGTRPNIYYQNPYAYPSYRFSANHTSAHPPCLPQRAAHPGPDMGSGWGASDSPRPNLMPERLRPERSRMAHTDSRGRSHILRGSRQHLPFKPNSYKSNVVMVDESVVSLSPGSDVKPPPSSVHSATRRDHSWARWCKDPNQPPSLTESPKQEEDSISRNSEIPSKHDEVATRTLIITVLFDLIPRQAYLHFLLRLPYLYFSRVTRIFEETEMSMDEIREQCLANKGNPFGYFPSDKIGIVKTWESFIDSLVGEWQTLNIVSVLLLSAILTILQIDAAASDPIIRYSALLSMICALMSLLYGCMYIIRFGSMKKAHKATLWAEEAQSTTTNIIWNVWVLLAMPATWLAWSIILFVTCISAFIWRTSPGDPGSRPISNPLWPRILLSIILGLALIYFILIIATLRRYGDAMDQTWRTRVETWAESGPYTNSWGNNMADGWKNAWGENSTGSIWPECASNIDANPWGRDTPELRTSAITPVDQPKSEPSRNPSLTTSGTNLGEVLNSKPSNTDRDAVGIYEICYSDETQNDSILWKRHLGLEEAGAFRVYDIDSRLEESFIYEEQHNKFRDTVLTNETFDKASINILCHILTLLRTDKSQDSTYCIEDKNDDTKSINDADLKDILDVLKTFNEEIFSPSDYMLVLCNEVSARAVRKSVYFIPKTIAKGEDTPTPSLSGLNGPIVKPDALLSEEVDSSDPDREAVDMYEISYSGKTRIDTLMRNPSESAQAGELKVYDIDSDLEESLLTEEQCNKYRFPPKQIFDNLAKDLWSCTRCNSDEQRRLSETDLESVINVLKIFNDEVCSQLNFRLILCYKDSVGASNESVYIVPKMIANVASHDTESA